MDYPIKLEECTWTEVDAAMRDGRDTVIIPTASVEQHGPHLPLITDSLIGEALAARVAGKLGNAFAAPVVRPGLSEHHMAFPGSMTLSTGTFIQVLEEVCLSLAEHGFRNLVLISSHGGNFAAVNQAAAVIQERVWEKGLAATVKAAADLELYTRWQQDYLVHDLNGRSEEAAGHADVVETAMMLALRPDLVHMERAEAGWMGDPMGVHSQGVNEQIFSEGVQSLSANGVMGDPRRASAEMGEKLLDYLSDEMSFDIRAKLMCPV